MGDFHKNLVLDDNHALNARTYADIAARDADTTFNGDATNINKIVRVDTPLSFSTWFLSVLLFGWNK